MERTLELYEKIDAYLNGALTSDELTSFEHLISVSPNLKEEVEKQALIKNALSDSDTIHFRDKIEKIASEIEKKEEAKTSPLSYWKVAAGFVLFAGLSSLFWLLNPVKENVFEKYYVPYPVEDLTRGQEIASHSLLNELTTNYQKKEYKKVIALIENEMPNALDDDRLQLYLGNSYLNIGDESLAINIFNSIAVGKEYFNDAQWFLALTYIKNNDITKALPILKNLGAAPNLYTKRALQLIEDISSENFKK